MLVSVDLAVCLHWCETVKLCNFKFSRKGRSKINLSSDDDIPYRQLLHPCEGMCAYWVLFQSHMLTQFGRWIIKVKN